MCGICGEVFWNGQFALEQNFKPMLKALERRGPDDGGLWTQDQVGLGHRRLAIIDLTEAGHQPMVDGSLTLVFNGCIYNYQSLRQELIDLGHHFQSHSDTEVILKAYVSGAWKVLSGLRGCLLTLCGMMISSSCIWCEIVLALSLCIMHL